MLNVSKENILLTGILLLLTLKLTAQDTSRNTLLSFGGYIETYYLYDFNKPLNNSVPLAYNHSRHNEFAVNLALITANYTSKNVRANLALQTGTYPESNYAIEPQIFRQVYDANLGVKLHKRIWLDAGIFGASHIGFESAIGTNNWTLTRSLNAENTPYYETGAKLSYKPDSAFLIALLVLNGWQNIRDQNNNKAVGSQVTWKPSNKLTLNSSTFIGNEKPDTISQFRYFHNFYMIYQPIRKIGIAIGIDAGAELERDSANRKLTGKYNTWYNPTLIFRYTIYQKLKIAVRGELYKDINNVILPVNRVVGYSTNLDYLPNENVLMRIEYRYLNASDKVFSGPKGNIYFNRPTVALSISANF